MTDKLNLRHEIGIIASHSQTLAKALQAIPDDRAVLEDAWQALSREEQRQLNEYLGTLAITFGQLKERMLRLRSRLNS